MTLVQSLHPIVYITSENVIPTGTLPFLTRNLAHEKSQELRGMFECSVLFRYAYRYFSGRSNLIVHIMSILFKLRENVYKWDECPGRFSVLSYSLGVAYPAIRGDPPAK